MEELLRSGEAADDSLVLVLTTEAIPRAFPGQRAALNGVDDLIGPFDEIFFPNSRL